METSFNQLLQALFSILCAFVLTIAVETLVALALGYRRGELYAIFLCNLLTNPLLNFLLLLAGSLFGLTVRTILILPLELCVVAAEFLLLRYMLKLTWTKAFLLSFLINACSYGVGVLIFGVG